MVKQIARRVAAKASQIKHILAHAANPGPLILDSLRLQRSPYMANLKDGVRFALEPGQGDWFTLYECHIRRDYLRHGIKLGAGDVVLDIGANFGAFAVLASKIVGPGGHVYAFEPSPGTYARLEENIRLNGCTNVTVFREAIGATDGETDFFISGKSAYSSLHQTVDTRAGAEAARVTVKSRTISSVLTALGKKIDLLKVDCEGGEYALFDAISDQEIASISQISMELHNIPGEDPASLKEKIRGFGYETRNTYPFVALRQS